MPCFHIRPHQKLLAIIHDMFEKAFHYLAAEELRQVVLNQSD